MGTPTVTVILPTRDRWSLAARAALSALEQRDIAIEVIVVDDGSVGSPPPEPPLSADRVRIVRHPVSRGLGAARNRGVSEARTNWVAFLDDDDLWAPEKLASQLHAARAVGADFVYCSAYLVDAELRVRGLQRATPVEMLPTALLERNAIPAAGSNILVRRDVMLRSGGFDETFHQLVDWDLSLRLSNDDAIRMTAVDDALIAYTQHAGNMAATPRQRLLPEWRRLRRKHRTIARRRGRRFRSDRLIHWYVGRLQLGGRRWRAAATGTAWGLLLRDPRLLRDVASGLRHRATEPLSPSRGHPPWLQSGITQSETSATRERRRQRQAGFPVQQPRSLTARQAIALIIILALAAGVITAAALGRQSLAIALVGPLLVVIFAAVLQLGRRLGHGLEGLASLRLLEGRRHLEVRSEIKRMREEIRALTRSRYS